MRKALVVVLLVIVMAAFGQTAKPTQPAKLTASEPAQSHAGKYQLFFSPLARADVYLVDTETGRIWKPVTINNAKDTNLTGAPEVWIYQDRIDTEQQFDTWQIMHPATTPAATQ
jgi:hypothetical protein